ncbi:hypothetical protein niasHT_028846 [Heterodera trifolii]|uniref:MATH domain-containing protein n=1 Tax=Heterodera trifolii TaxID=157864 RepID=A0ABD2KS31_9BILA
MAYIEKNGKALFESEQFLQIDQNLLCEILDKLRSISELNIWEATFCWANEKCRENSIECTGENCRTALGPALFKIRFPLMTKEDFLKIPSGLLTNEEMLGIYQFHCHPPNSPGAFPLKFPSQGRICDRNKGTLLLVIEKLSQFARENFGSERSSETVHIKGMPWKILAQIKKENDGTKKFLGFFLLCTASKEDPNWKFKCSATLRIVSQMNGMKDWIGKFNDHIFNNKSRDWGFPNLITFEQLMNASKGLHDRVGDKVTLAIDITEVEKLDSNPYKPNGTILMKIDKFSEFAQEFCGSERSSKIAKLMNSWRGFYEEKKDEVTLAIDVFVEEPKMDKFDSDPNKSTGKIVLEIGKFSEFARETNGSERSSETVLIGGLPWRILAKIEEYIAKKHLSFFLWCAAPMENENWSCKCSSITIRIVSQKSGTEDLKKKFKEKRLFNSKSSSWKLFSFACRDFMDSSNERNAFYNKNKDSLTVAIDLILSSKNVKK